jgi:hypothetical protein
MRGFFVCSKIAAVVLLGNTAYFWGQNPDFKVKVAQSYTFT